MEALKHFYPLDKVFITQYFGQKLWQKDAKTGQMYEAYARFGMQGHNGLDFRVKFVDSPLGRREVSASQRGKAIVGFDAKGYGHFVRILHPDGSETVYGHLTRALIRNGDVVDAQQVIGLTGNSGFSTGAHLHWGYRPPSARYDNGFKGYVDPMTVLIDNPVPKQVRLM